MTTINQTLLLIISVWPPNFRAALPPRWGPTLQISTGCIQCPLCHQQRPSFKTKHLALHHQAVVFTDVLRILLILQFLVRLWHQTGCSGQFVFVDQGVKLPLPALSFTFSGARSITVMATHRVKQFVQTWNSENPRFGGVGQVHLQPEVVPPASMEPR